MTERDLQDAIESLIDQTTLFAVIDAAACVASAKSEHIETNWQDKTTAGVWMNAAIVLAEASVKVEGI